MCAERTRHLILATNLGVRSSNLFGRAIFFNELGLPADTLEEAVCYQFATT